MDQNLTEEEQIEALKRWWKANGRAVIIGILLGVAAVGGYRYWDYTTTQKALAASDIYVNLQEALTSGKKETVLGAGERLLREYPGTSYAGFAALAMAKVRVDEDRLDAAAEHLRWALDNARSDVFAHVARTRLARVLLAQGKAEAVLTLIADLPDNGFSADYQDIRGDALLALQRPEEAREAWNIALLGATDARQRQFIQIKLEHLPAPAEAAPAEDAAPEATPAEAAPAPAARPEPAS